ncbi:MAG: FAD-dependent oxidoreductase [Gemmatimonadaceae bacterium]
MTSAGRPDAIVIGAGIVGAACAEALSRDGLRVLVLDAGFAGGGTTAAGMGHLVAMDDSPAQLALTSYSLECWRALAPELGREIALRECGTLWIAENDEQLAAVRAKKRLYHERGLAAEELDARALASAEPRLREGLAGALHVAGDAVLYPPCAALRLLALARARGAELREGWRVLSIGGGGVRGARETISAGVIVIATGADAPRLTPGLPIVPRKGHLVITDRHPGFCHHQLVELGYLTSAHEMTAESVAFNVQPRETGQLLIGSSRELVGLDATINRPLVARMLARAASFLPAIAALSAIRVWTGFRPATPDSLPLIGAWETGENVMIAAGHEGLGITTATGTARIIADLVAGRAPAIDAAPYSPVRGHAAAVH